MGLALGDSYFHSERQGIFWNRAHGVPLSLRWNVTILDVHPDIGLNIS